MTVEHVYVGEISFDIVTERVTDIEVSRGLYDLLELDDGEGGYYNTHRGSYNITELLESIEEDGLEEYEEDDITEDDLELLRACKFLLDNGKVDVINFIEERYSFNLPTAE